MKARTLTIQRHPDRKGIDVPARYAVCRHCSGEGRVLHPAIAVFAYSAEAFRECFSDEEAAEYFRGGQGRYGVICATCRGARVVLVVDRDQLTPRQRVIVEAFDRIEARRAAEDRADRLTQQREAGVW